MRKTEGCHGVCQPGAKLRAGGDGANWLWALEFSEVVGDLKLLRPGTAALQVAMLRSGGRFGRCCGRGRPRSRSRCYGAVGNLNVAAAGDGRAPTSREATEWWCGRTRSLRAD